MNRRDDDDEVMRDGQRVRVPLTMMDSMQRAIAQSATFDAALHRPGYRFGDPAEQAVRDAVRITREAMLADAWRTPATVAPVADAATGRNGYLDRLENGWKVMP